MQRCAWKMVHAPVCNRSAYAMSPLLLPLLLPVSVARGGNGVLWCTFLSDFRFPTMQPSWPKVDWNCSALKACDGVTTVRPIIDRMARIGILHNRMEHGALFPASELQIVESLAFRDRL
ncbi:unnamed protein product [Ostreobium quekettii]|uniref:Secreted protein n=1 Tax=Ostreobium quekettii TaxID=121088 RepID=A0A8S1IQJ3_9CHLO|nr:unnamed protein product [Ostreobium quekettii]